MTGVMMVLATSRGSISGTSHTMVTGYYSTTNPSGTITRTLSGYSSGYPVTSFGSITPTTDKGFTIRSLYHLDVNGNGGVAAFYVTGNAVGQFSGFRVGDTSYFFTDAGTYDSASNTTSFSTNSIGSSPFYGTITVIIG